jgi:hypothetical protein
MTTDMDPRTELRTLIARIRRRWFKAAALRTSGRAMAAASLPLIAALSVEVAIRPEGAALMLLSLATVAATVTAGAWIARRMPRRASDRQVARFIEERAGALSGGQPLDDALVSAIEALESTKHSAAAGFLPLIVADAVRRLRAIDRADVVTPRSFRAAAGQALAGGAVLALALTGMAPALGRGVETAWLRFLPGSVRVEVTPGNARVAAGTPLRIRTLLHGSAGRLKHFAPSLTVAAGGGRRTVQMAPAGDGFEYAIESVDRSFSYSVAAGSARSEDYRVTALFAPRVTRIDLHYAYPSFAGLAPRDEQDGGDIYAPAGTRVRLRIQTDKPIARGEIALGGAATVPARPAGDRIVEADLVLAKNDSYRVRLADADGLRSSGDTEYFIRLMDDRPPDVRILRPSSDQQVTPLEEIAIEARADDDYGVASFDLVYGVAGGAPRTVPFDRVTGTSVQKIGSRLLSAEELHVQPGDVITYYARARDVGRGKRSTEATSDIFFLEVKPFNEEFVAAQSQAGGGAAEAQIESLVEAQKQIIASTWNIERRSQAGRSADDVKAVGEAQAELKARAEQMASGGRRGRGRAPAPQRIMFDQPDARVGPARDAQQSGPAGGDPIAAAVEAMTKAMQELATERTKEALPHEMAALNGLLRAQAEVRRRQVAQQQASGAGSGGSNRSGQDLSALFDKELQRQQRTNYETRSAVETRPDGQQSNDRALDRIRDLARRQEDLSRRERELGQAGLTAEDMKRQLETLTREQVELREQAEELARRMGQTGQPQGRQDQAQRGSSGQQPSRSPGQRSPQRGSQGQAGGGDLRGASDQMRSAAGELRRDDPNAAAESGERAAEQLRRIEQRMRGGSAEAKQRAASDVQVEAQQIAQEQRRIAAEAERLAAGSGSAAAEARRRLADDKNRLAGRVDELERAARQLSQSEGSRKTGSALGEAARDLERDRVADRMRDTAKQMRDPAGTPNGALGQTEREIARALERVADKLDDTGGSAEARQLASQLDQTRAIRDRLQRLEQQMRDAEGRERGAAGGARGEAGTGQGGGRGQAQGASEVRRLQEEYRRELERARQALGQLNGQPQSGGGGSTPEQQEFSRSAPGTEAFKQDRSGWESLRKNLDLALEKYEAAASERLARRNLEDRFSAGGSERVPEGYRRHIAKYFESLAANVSKPKR